jgi:hypothetical protein
MIKNQNYIQKYNQISSQAPVDFRCEEFCFNKSCLKCCHHPIKYAHRTYSVRSEFDKLDQYDIELVMENLKLLNIQIKKIII